MLSVAEAGECSERASKKVVFNIGPSRFLSSDIIFLPARAQKKGNKLVRQHFQTSTVIFFFVRRIMRAKNSNKFYKLNTYKLLLITAQ